MGERYTSDLRGRLFRFAANTIRLIMSLPGKKEFDVFRWQLSKSATSIGANYEEAQAGTTAEFKHRITICLREARETDYWLRLIKELNIINNPNPGNDLMALLSEISEIQKIFGAIAVKVKNK